MNFSENSVTPLSHPGIERVGGAGERRAAAWLAAPSATALRALVLGVLVGWPITAVLGEAWRSRGASEPGPSLVAQRAALGLNTVALALGVVGIAVPAGTGLAMILFRTDLPARRLLALAVLLPMLLPIDIQATAWLAALGRRGWTGSLGLPIELAGLAGATWVHAMAALPWVVALVGAAVRSVEGELEEECLLAAGPRATLWHVTLRRSLAGIAAAALLVAALSAGEMAVTDLLQVRTYAETVYTDFAVFGRIGAATMTALPGLVVLVAVVSVAAWLVGRAVPLHAESWGIPRPVFRLGRWRAAAVLAVCLAIVPTLGVPFLSLAWRAGVEYPSARRGAAARSRPSGVRPEARHAAVRPHWSPRTLVRTVRDSAAVSGEEAGYSIALAAAAAAAAVSLSFWLAWGARRSRSRRALAAAAVVVLVALPGPVLGAGISLAVNGAAAWCSGDGGVPNWWGGLLAALADSPAVLVWLFTVRSLPFALVITGAALGLVDASQLEAAELDGAGAWTRFRHIAWPAAWPAAAAAALVAAVLSIGEVSGAVIVAPPGVQPLSVRIFTLAHYGVENHLAGICLVLLAVSGAAGIAAMAALGWAARGLRRAADGARSAGSG